MVIDATDATAKTRSIAAATVDSAWSHPVPATVPPADRPDRTGRTARNHPEPPPALPWAHRRWRPATRRPVPSRLKLAAQLQLHTRCRRTPHLFEGGISREHPQPHVLDQPISHHAARLGSPGDVE